MIPHIISLCSLLHTVTGGMGIGMTVHRTLTHPGFLKDPHESASEVWEMSGLVTIVLYNNTWQANGQIHSISNVQEVLGTQWCYYENIYFRHFEFQW